MVKLFFKQIANDLPSPVRNVLDRQFRRGRFRDFQAMRSIETTTGYSLKPFDDNHCIFVRIPKCATRSVSKALFGNFAGGHRSLREYQKVFSPEEFSTYFKFCVVRNPWDRLASAFFFLQRGGISDEDKIWIRKNLSMFDSFDDFVNHGLRLENIQSYDHFRPQVDFITLNNTNEIGVDFIAYYENLNKDFERIRNRLDINAELLTLNINSSKRDYRSYYSEKMIQIVADVYKKDIDLFGYDFDSSFIINRDIS